MNYLENISVMFSIVFKYFLRNNKIPMNRLLRFIPEFAFIF